MELRRWRRSFFFISSLTVHVITMSSSRKELSIQKCSSIITLAKEGYSVREIAVKTKIPKSTVHDTVKKLTDNNSFEYKKRTGRPKKTTQNEDRYIQTLSKRNRRMTAPEIAAEVNKDREDPIGTTTVKRRLLQAGLRGCVAVRKPLLRTQNKKKRLQWAKLYKNFTAQDWEKVLWTDESKFEVFGAKRRIHVRRKQTEKLIADCIVPTVKHGGQSVMVWGCFGANRTGDLVQIEGILKKEQYLQILREHAVPSGKRLIGPNFIFMQDNDPKHTAKICTEYLKDLQNNNELKIMVWPPQSPDLNPIEKLWDEVDRDVRKVCPKSKKHLWELLQKSWRTINCEKLKKLLDRMPRIVQAVIAARGGYIDEQKI